MKRLTNLSLFFLLSLFFSCGNSPNTEKTTDDKTVELAEKKAKIKGVSAILVGNNSVRPFKITDYNKRIITQLSYFHGLVEYDI